MKWFKHQSNASMDAKLRKIRLKYGMEGYGLYWYCLELIAQTVETHNLSFELEHDAEIIASDTGIHIERVQEMMVYMVELGLFDNDRGVVTCLKMQKWCDEYIGKVIRNLGPSRINSGDTPEKVPPNRTEQNRTEQNRTENTTAPAVPTGDSPEFLEFKSVYPKRIGAQPWSKARKAINARLKDGSTWEEIITGAKRYAVFCDATDKTTTEYVMQAASFCGPEKHFSQPWDVPRTVGEAKQDKTVAAGLEFLDDDE